MTRVPSDTRPRILDFTSATPGIEILQFDNLAWPCAIYRATIPVRPHGELNVFEETVLKLVAAAKADGAWLSETTCLPRDFVLLILNRLHDKGLIAKGVGISDKGGAYLEQRDQVRPDYEIRTLFRERLGGGLLPIVYDGDLCFEELAESNAKRARIRVGTAGTSRTISLRMLTPQPLDELVRPTADELLAAAKQQRKLNERCALLSRPVGFCPIIEDPASITIDRDPEEAFLRCKIVIQEGSTDFRIVDPFGYGFSDILERAYRERIKTDREENDHVLNLKKRAVTVRVGDDKPKSDAQADVFRLFGAAVRRYPELLRRLESSEKGWRACAAMAHSSDEETQLRSSQLRLHRSLYEAIEWAFRYVASASRAATFQDVLSQGTYIENGAFLADLARQLGIHVTPPDPLLEVPPGRFRSLHEGVVEMQPLLALMLGGAVSDPAHPFRRLAARYPDWLEFLRKLKRARDASAHGDSAGADSAQTAWFRETVYGALRSLFTEFTQEPEDPWTSEGAARPDALFDQRLRARVALETQLGVQGFAMLEPETAELLIQVELEASAWQPASTDLLEADNMIVNLASVLQQVVHQLRLRLRRRGFDPGTADLDGAVLRSVLDAGFEIEGEKLPKSLAPSRQRLEQALNGLSPSLAACLVALIVASQPDCVRDVARRAPGLVQLCGRILDLRKHGNQTIWLPTKELVILKQEVIANCQKMMEI